MLAAVAGFGVLGKANAMKDADLSSDSEGIDPCNLELSSTI
jgi:hypothetical protein